MIEWLGPVIVVVVVLAIVFYYNKFVKLKKRVENAWSQIDVQLKRRANLIPNLIETVKGYAKFEKKVLTEVTAARTSIMNAKTPAAAAKGENQLSGALKTIFAVAESYPKLTASENFKSLQEEFATTENKIAYARQFYNDSVMEINTAISLFPGNLIARIFGMAKESEFFETEGEERKVVKADFSDLA